ncbi:hypothetical protein [Leptolyngbya phage Lbo-JY46]
MTLTREQKLKAIKDAVTTIQKEHGTGSVVKMSEMDLSDVSSTSTGSLGLDIALGIGGLPRGRIIEIYGPESSGKSTLCQHIIAEAQKKGGICAYVDVEHSLEGEYATSLGINLNELYISQPSSAQEALNIVDKLIETNSFDVVVLDSVAALVPQEELDGEIGESKMGISARLMGQTLRKITPKADKANTLVVFVNQLRDKIGVMYGSPETTPGGNALKFFCTIRIDIRKKDTIKIKEDVIGIRVKANVRKNKISPPFKSAEFNIMFGKGIDQDGEIFGIAVDLGIINRAGAWFSYKDIKTQGGADFQKLMADNEELREEIKKLVIDSIKR